MAKMKRKKQQKWSIPIYEEGYGLIMITIHFPVAVTLEDFWKVISAYKTRLIQAQ